MSRSTEKYVEYLIDLFGEDKTNKLIKYIDLVLEKNKFINLTAVKDKNAAIEKHIIDSLSIVELEEYKKAKTIIDVGTGAGFPGALLAIVSPEKEFVLLDSTLKRLKVINEFAELLQIDNIKTVHGRAEELYKSSEYGEAFDVCVSRAVANLDTLSKWCLPFVRKEGYFLAYKGENYKEEYDAAKSSINKLKGKLTRVETFKNAGEEISGHVILVIKK